MCDMTKRHLETPSKISIFKPQWPKDNARNTNREIISHDNREPVSIIPIYHQKRLCEGRQLPLNPLELENGLWAQPRQISATSRLCEPRNAARQVRCANRALGFQVGNLPRPQQHETQRASHESAADEYLRGEEGVFCRLLGADNLHGHALGKRGRQHHQYAGHGKNARKLADADNFGQDGRHGRPKDAADAAGQERKNGQQGEIPLRGSTR
jgi:hypothetical protein